MKRIREYHIEHYWQTEAARREKRAEFKEKVLEKVILGGVFALFCAVSYGFIAQIFEVI